MAETTGGQAAPPQRGPQDFEKVLDRSSQEVASFATPHRTPLDRLQHAFHANPTLVPLIVLVLSIAVFSVIAPNFFSVLNLATTLQQVTVIGILALAQTIVILTAGIDLSVGAIMVLSYMATAILAVQTGIPAPLAVIVGILIGLLCGWLNGQLVTRFGLPPFIVTLGTWKIFLALNLYFSGSQTVRSQDIDAAAPLLKLWGTGINIGAPGANLIMGSFLMLILYAIFHYLLNSTAWGRHVYAVGDDKAAAELSGIRTDRQLVSVYMVAGGLCALAGWVAIGRVGAAGPQAFPEGNLEAITAVVIGGTSLFGGRGAVLGTLIGALIVGVFNSGLKIAGVNVLWQVFALGVLIIAAAAMDQWIRKVSK